MDKHSSPWVSIHIRDRLRDGTITIKDSFIYEYLTPPSPFLFFFFFLFYLRVPPPPLFFFFL